MRSSAVLALSEDGTGRVGSIICFAGASRCLVEPLDMRGSSSRNDTTVQRIAAPSFWNSIAVKTCVPSGSSGFWILTGTSNSGVKPRRTKSLCNLRLTKTEIGTTFRDATPEGTEAGTWREAASCVVAGIMLPLAGTAAVGDSTDPDG